MKRHLNTLFVTLEGAWHRKRGGGRGPSRGETKLRCRPQPGRNRLFRVDCGRLGLLDVRPARRRASPFLSQSLRKIPRRHERIHLRKHPPAPGTVTPRRSRARRFGDRGESDRRENREQPERFSSVPGVTTVTRTPPGLRVAAAADFLARRIDSAGRCTSLDSLRGIEGEAAAAYFASSPIS